LGATESCSHYGSVNKTIYTRQAELLRETLVEMRQKAGLTQRQLAAKLNRERNFIGRLELGERRLDVVEFYWICTACGLNPDTTASRLMRRLNTIQNVI
jgi:transcriptional regulator with XRE-family HTH domain